MPHKDPEVRRAYMREYQRTWRVRHRIPPFPHTCGHPGKLGVRRAGLCSDCGKKYRQFKTQLKGRYSLSESEWNEKILQQENKCAICGETAVGRRLSVDHNHQTGQIRGLLCVRCNAAIGHLREQPTTESARSHRGGRGLAATTDHLGQVLALPLSE